MATPIDPGLVQVRIEDMIATIPFPSLDPVAFHAGPLAVRWYGLAYLLGFVVAYALLRRMIRRGMLRLSPEALGDLVTWLVVGVMVGGRLGWWLFYHRAEGAAEPWYEPVAVWHGGMSFHGGLLGVGLALLLWSWRRRADFWNLADCLSLVAPIGLFFGRLANFVNAELVGRPTELPWAVIFPGDTIARHPSQLYEALLEGPLLLLLVWAAQKRAGSRDGRIASLFLILYGLFRFAVEFTRQPDEQLGFVAFNFLTMGQLLSVVMMVVGVALEFTPRTWLASGRVDSGTTKTIKKRPAGQESETMFVTTSRRA